MENKLYAEAFGVMCSLSDMKIDFMSVDPVPNEDGSGVVETRTLEQRVTLNLPMAKELSKKLSEAIAGYEATFGPIPDLDEMQKKAAREK